MPIDRNKEFLDFVIELISIYEPSIYMDGDFFKRISVGNKSLYSPKLLEKDFMENGVLAVDNEYFSLKISMCNRRITYTAMEFVPVKRKYIKIDSSK